jgi:hypothetical protein
MTAELVAQLESLLLDTGDVLIVYSAQPPVVDIASQTLGSLVRAPEASKILISETAAGTQVTVSIGVASLRSASEVSRDIHDLIAAELAASGLTLPLSISVKVASVAAEYS